MIHYGKGQEIPKATADGQPPDDDLADLNDPDTEFEPEDDTEIDRQEESDSDVEMSKVDMMHQQATLNSANRKKMPDGAEI